jgi:hypothetical protein
MRTGHYNGWSNWQTWNVLLWLNNDEGLYMATQDFARFPHRHTPDRVRRFVQELMPYGTPDMKTPEDMDWVNWEEVASTFQDDYDEFFSV